VDSTSHNQLARFFLGPVFSADGVGLLVAVVHIWIVHGDRTAMAGESTGWPSTVGLVDSSKVVCKTSRVETTTTRYYPKVSYKYTVKENNYTSKRITFGGIGPKTYENAESIASKYSSGKTLPIYYDPGSPALSVLEPGNPPSLIKVIFGTAVLTFVGLFFGSFGWQWSQEDYNSRRIGSCCTPNILRHV
jgi:hypothetical protein